jgi:hypothetical protein
MKPWINAKDIATALAILDYVNTKIYTDENLRHILPTDLTEARVNMRLALKFMPVEIQNEAV